MNDDYITKRPYRLLTEEFFKYINISEADMLLLFNFDKDRLEEFYSATNLSELSEFELECFLALIDNHLTVDYFDKFIDDDEHEYVWNHGKRLRTLIIDEQFKRGYKKDVKDFISVFEPIRKRTSD